MMVSEEWSYRIINDNGGPNLPSLDVRVYEDLRDHTWTTLIDEAGTHWEFNALYVSPSNRGGEVVFGGYAKNHSTAARASQLEFKDNDVVTLKVWSPL